MVNQSQSTSRFNALQQRATDNTEEGTSTTGGFAIQEDRLVNAATLNKSTFKGDPMMSHQSNSDHLSSLHQIGTSENKNQNMAIKIAYSARQTKINPSKVRDGV